MELIGVPFDLCGRRPGSRLGPAAVRLADLKGALGSIGRKVHDQGDVPVATSQDDCSSDGLRNFEPALKCVREVKAKVLSSLKSGETPLVIGGDHFIAAGSVSAALEVFEEQLAVLWVDAHADLNTPETSETGNLHGMPFAALLGLPSNRDGASKESRQWGGLLTEVIPNPRLKAGRSAWIGLRELDQAEQEALRNLDGRYVATMHDIDRYGIVECLAGFDSWMRASGARKLWLSLDVDVLDPLLAPGTGTAVRGGLSYREMHVLGEILYETLSTAGCPYSLAGLDLVEINPLTDSNNITALTAVEWIASLFGKRILGGGH